MSKGESDKVDVEGLTKQNRSIFEPLILPLDDQTVIYYEKITRLIRVTKLTADERGFTATAVPVARIEAWYCDEVPMEPWSFGASWWIFRLNGRSIYAPYAGWSLYTDSGLVARVTELLSLPDRPNLEIRKLLDEYDGNA